MNRRLSHNTRKSPAMTGGDDNILGNCHFDPEAFDVLQDQKRGPAHHIALPAARALCGIGEVDGELVMLPAEQACPLRAECFRRNEDEAWLKVLLGIDPRKEPTERPTCGSPAGYKAHRDADEVPCDPCTMANRARQAAAARKRRAARASGTTPQEALEQGRSIHRARNAERNDARLADLKALAKAGAGVEEACAQLNVSRDALYAWCTRNGHGALWRRISPRKPAAIVARPRRKKAAA